jgi:hypothetical protein
MLAARDFLRAPVLRCSAPFWTALSIRETRALCSLATADASPDWTADSSRLKWVFTELRKRRFSCRSRSERAIRFFCEAILAMKTPAVRAAKRIEQ